MERPPQTSSSDYVPHQRMIPEQQMDKLELLMDAKRYIHDCCGLVISESWLHPPIPDAAIQLTRHIVHRSDSNKEGLGKSRGVVYASMCIMTGPKIA